MCRTDECGCRHQAHHSPQGMGHHQGHCAGGFEHRRFFTKEETTARLEEYLTYLKAETKGLEEHIAERGYQRRGKHHEIYLSDPRRTAPERLKTIIRQPMGE